MRTEGPRAVSAKCPHLGREDLVGTTGPRRGGEGEWAQ